MFTRRLSTISLVALLTAGMTACTATPSLGIPLPFVASPTPTATPVPPTPTPSAGPCSNSLSPVSDGATWTYTNTTQDSTPWSFSTTITSVRPDGFTMTTKLPDGTTADQEWDCNSQGLLPLTPGAGQPALGLSVEGIKLDLTTSNPRGVTVPVSVQPGMTWNYGLDLEGTLAQGNLSASIKGTVDTAFNAVGMESVTVPAGTFNAMKIQGASTFNVTANYSGLGIPLTAVVNSTFWFAPGVGLIKSTQSGQLVGISMNSSTELQSYSLP